ncbi:MAG: hypothetical protein R6V27_13915 [Balneolaceae bacterium]
MKRIYSLILLLSFTLGVLQPVMPMVEYVVAEGDLTELFHSHNGTNTCPVTNQNQGMESICQACDCNESSADESLLDTDFYPIPLQTVQYSGDHALTVISEGHALADEQTLSNYYATTAPPPRQV